MVTWLNHWGQAWLEYFGLLAVQNTLFLGLVFLALYLFRRAPANVRYAIGLVGLFKLLLPAFIPAPFLAGPTIAGKIIGDLLVADPVSAAASPADQQIQLSYQALLLLLWMVLALGMFSYPIISLIRLKTRLRSSEPVALDIRTTSRTVKIYQCDDIAIPLTVGFLPDRVFVPKLWDQWSAESREMIIQHELAHIKRRDGLISFIQILIQAIYFFHPLVWLLNRRINEYREMACDDSIVSRKKGSSFSYPRLLADVAENIVVTQPGCVTAATLIRKKNELLKRIKYQLEDTMCKHSRLRTGLLMAALLVMILPLSFTYTGSDVDRLTPVAEMMNSAPEVQSQAPQEVGKIYGVVTYVETGEPLPGANIVIEGTRMGAAADNNGQYFIINVPPGTYTLKAFMMGFESVAFGEVIVKVMESTEVNFSLTVIRIEGEMKVTPPPPEQGPNVRFIPYDVKPEPIGGFAAIQENVIYPESALQAGIEGEVIVMVFVNEDGWVTETVILKGIPDSGLNEAAMDAIRRTRFTPARQRDRNVGVWIPISLVSSLAK